MNASPTVFAAPRLVSDIDECTFYHTVDIPGHGTVEGYWDLRRGVDRYLGGIDVRGKRVLELGTADGFITFEMERRGARVVSFDLDEMQTWDVVPYARFDHRGFGDDYRQGIFKINNAYWFCHRLFESEASMVYGSVYDVPEQIGPVDVTTFGSILLHVRDPFQALRSGLRLSREMVIVTDLLSRSSVPGPLRAIRKLVPRRVLRPLFGSSRTRARARTLRHGGFCHRRPSSNSGSSASNGLGSPITPSHFRVGRSGSSLSSAGGPNPSSIDA
jgi:hypothetical protein